MVGDIDVNYDCYISTGISNEESFSIDFLHKYELTKEDCYVFDGIINIQKISHILKKILVNITQIYMI